MTTRLDQYAIEEIIGQSPCVCGSWATWHPKCYAGKTQEEINAACKKAYVFARKYIKAKAIKSAQTAFEKSVRVGYK